MALLRLLLLLLLVVLMLLLLRLVDAGFGVGHECVGDGAVRVVPT